MQALVAWAVLLSSVLASDLLVEREGQRFCTIEDTDPYLHAQTYCSRFFHVPVTTISTTTTVSTVTVSTTSTVYRPTGDCTGSSANQKLKRTVSPNPTSTRSLLAPQCLHPYTNSPSALRSKCLSYYPAGTSTELTTTRTITRTHFHAPTHIITTKTTVTTVAAPPECAATATAAASAALGNWTRIYDVCRDTRNPNWDSVSNDYAIINAAGSDACGALASCAGQVPAGATSFELVFYNIPYIGLSWLCEWYYTNDYQLVYDGQENEYGDTLIQTWGYFRVVNATEFA